MDSCGGLFLLLPYRQLGHPVIDSDKQGREYDDQCQSDVHGTLLSAIPFLKSLRNTHPPLFLHSRVRLRHGHAAFQLLFLGVVIPRLKLEALVGVGFGESETHNSILRVVQHANLGIYLYKTNA